MGERIQFLDLGEAEYPSKYGDLLAGFANSPETTKVFVPFQDHPNLPGFKINTIEIDGKTLYHGVSSQSVKGLMCIPIFSDFDEVRPSYGKYFEMISLPISEVVKLISEDSSAQGLMLDMFSLNVILDGYWVEGIKEAMKDSEAKDCNFTEKFVKYCREKYHDELNTADERSYCYNSLPICIVDCVYSLRARYNSVTVPIVERYANRYLNGDKTSNQDSLTDFISNLKTPGLKYFADEVAKNHQILGHVPKEKICLDIAETLVNLGIETLEDFQSYPLREKLADEVKSVKGMGTAGVNYLFMLTGDDSRSKPDVHIHRCISEACGKDVSDSECQRIIEDSVKILKTNYPNLTVRKLDGVIWRDFSTRSKGENE